MQLANGAVVHDFQGQTMEFEVNQIDSEVQIVVCNM